MNQAGSSGGRPGFAVDPFRLRRAVARHWRLLLGAGLAGALLGVVTAKFIMGNMWESTAVLKFEGSNRIEGMPHLRDQLLPTADALRSQAMLRRVAEEVGYEGPLRLLGQSIDYGVNDFGGTLEISVVAETAQDAEGFVRTVTDVFTKYHEERQAERIEIEIQRIAHRISAAETEASNARQRYDEFRHTHGIADLSSEQESMLESAARLRADSELAASEIRALEAQVRSLESQFAKMPATRVVGDVSPERAAYHQLRQELATAQATLSDGHPRVQSLKMQVKELGQRIRAGGRGSSGGLVATNFTRQAVQEQLRTATSNLEALRERQRGLVELADKARERVDAFSDIEGDASALLADVKVNENLVQSLRRTEARLEDVLRNPSSGFIILDPGSAPELPVRNKAKLVVAAGFPTVFFGIALLFALWVEFRGLRAQTAVEVAFWGRGPVVATSSWPSDPQGLDELVVGLDDYAPESLLIVAGTPELKQLATDFADRMNAHWRFTRGAEAAPMHPYTQHPRAPSVRRGGPLQTPPPPPQGAPQSVRPRTGPIQTPPPQSGPYPISGSSSTALATTPSVSPSDTLAHRHDTEANLEAWQGPFQGQSLRRAARLAERVVVLVESGSMTFFELNGARQRLGRDGGVAYILVGLPSEFSTLPDRVGNVAGFWG